MHQQPPHTPLFASTNAAKSGQVSVVSALVMNSPMTVSMAIARDGAQGITSECRMGIRGQRRPKGREP
jgi:hypothetical protein